MKMVAGARLNKAQQRILAMRAYAVKTGQVLAEVTAAAARRLEESGGSGELEHPLLVRRPENRTLLLVITSDRGLCGAFNTNILRLAERLWREREGSGQDVKIAVIGRKGRDFFKRRNAPIFHVFSGVWDRLALEQARTVAKTVLKPFVAGEVDSIYLVYNEFKSAMSQRVVAERLFPVETPSDDEAERAAPGGEPPLEREFIFEPSKEALMERLVPMYVEISI